MQGLGEKICLGGFSGRIVRALLHVGLGYKAWGIEAFWGVKEGWQLWG